MPVPRDVGVGGVHRCASPDQSGGPSGDGRPGRPPFPGGQGRRRSLVCGAAIRLPTNQQPSAGGSPPRPGFARRAPRCPVDRRRAGRRDAPNARLSVLPPDVRAALLGRRSHTSQRDHRGDGLGGVAPGAPFAGRGLLPGPIRPRHARRTPIRGGHGEPRTGTPCGPRRGPPPGQAPQRDQLPARRLDPARPLLRPSPRRDRLHRPAVQRVRPPDDGPIRRDGSAPVLSAAARAPLEGIPLRDAWIPGGDR